MSTESNDKHRIERRNLHINQIEFSYPIATRNDQTGIVFYFLIFDFGKLWAFENPIFLISLALLCQNKI